MIRLMEFADNATSISMNSNDLIASVNSHFETRSINKADPTTSAIFTRNVYKFIISGRQVSYGFVVFVTGAYCPISWPRW